MSGLTLKSGFLFKKVPLRRNIHRRWFVLFKSELVYFKDQPTKLKGQKPLSTIPLVGCSVTKIKEELYNRTPYYSFEITHHDRGSVWLASEIEVDAAAWLSILEDTCLKIAILPPASKLTFGIDPQKDFKLEGYLEKRSYQNPNNWKRRYFVLNTKKITYSKNQFDVSTIAGHLLLSTQSQVSRDTESGRPNSFILQRQGQRSYVLNSESHGEMEAWINILERVIEWLNLQKRSRVSVYAAERKNGLNFETYRAKNAKSSEEILKSLLHFPDIEYKVHKKNRETRTLSSSVPNELIRDKEHLPQHVRDCVSVFTRPFTIIEYTDRYQFGTGRLNVQPQQQNDKYIDISTDIDQSEDPKVTIEILKEWVGELSSNDLKGIKGMFNINRENLIQLFSEDVIPKLMATDPRNYESTLPYNSSSSIANNRLFVECCEITFDIGNIEPMFGSLCLYDLENNAKLSETYHFNTNSKEMLEKLSLMDLSSTISDPSTLTSKAIFSISHKSPSIYLLVRIEKVLRGDPELFYDTYQRGTLKPKKLAKYIAEVDEMCSRFGDYRQPFVWSAIPLFDSQGQLLYHDKEELSIDLYRFTKDIGDEYISDRIQGMIQKKLKPLPGRFALKLRMVRENETFANLVDPSLNPIIDSNNNNINQIERTFTPGSRAAIKQTSSISSVIETLSGGSMIREIREFPVNYSSSQPILTYAHDLYIYPKFANFTNLASANRTITLELSLLNTDQLPPSVNANSKNFECAIYGKSCNQKFSETAISVVTYHNKKPQFYDEFKIKLPPILQPTHHLLFTVKHVTISKKNSIPDELIGYCVLKLMDENSQWVIGTDFQLNAFVELPENYTSSDVSDNLKTVGNRPAVDLKMKLHSSIWSNDPYLQDFFYSYSYLQSSSTDYDTEKVCKALRSLPKTSLEEIFLFLPMILDELFNIISSPFPSIGVEGFWCLINILTRIVQTQNRSTRQPFLESYVAYLFQNGASENFAVYEEVCYHWASVLLNKPHSISSNFLEEMCKFSWFLFEITSKSMVLKLNSSKLNIPREKRYSKDFLESLDELLTNLLTVVQIHTNHSDSLHLAVNLNSDIGYFFKDIINVMDRGVVLDFIGKYVRDLNPNRNAILERLKFQFLGIICDHEHYIPLNIPIKVEIDTVANLSSRLWEKHFLVGLLLHEVLALQLSPEAENRLIGIEFLRNLLLRHSLDPRYQMIEKQMRISGLYFPYLLNICEDKTRAVLSFDNRNEKKIWLICVLYLLKSCDPELLKCWWLKETQSNLRFFFAILNDCLETFESTNENNLSQLSARMSIRTSISMTRRNNVRQKDIAQQSLARQSILNSQKLMRKPTNIVLKNINLIKSKDVILFKEVCITVLNSLMEFMHSMETELKEENSDIMENAISTVILLLKKSQSVSFLKLLLLNIQVIINKYPEVFFLYQNNYSGQIIYELLRHCCFDSHEVRSISLTVWFNMFEINYRAAKGNNISRMKYQSIISISKLIGEGSKQYSYFSMAISALEKETLNNIKEEGLKDLILNLTTNLSNILEKSIKIRECDYDPESTAHYYYEIIRSYEDAPELQVAWLDSLSQIHLNNDNIEESAQCYIQQSAIIATLLHSSPSSSSSSSLRQKFSLSPNIFLEKIRRISPNIGKEFALPNVNGSFDNLNISGCFSEEQLFHLLTTAGDQFKQINLYEHATDIGRLLAHIYQSRGDFEKAHEVYDELHSLCEEIIKFEASKTRKFPKFYLISFFGKKFEELDGKSFIYKEKHSVTLPLMIRKLKDQYEVHFGPNSVHVVQTTDTKQVEIPPNKLCIQIAKVHKYIKADDSSNSRFFSFSHNNHSNKTNESEFVPWLNNLAKPRPSETTSKGLLAVSGTRTRLPSVADKQLLKVVLTTEFSFPCLRKGLEVVQKDQWILSPIENSTEIITKQNAKIRDVLNRRPTSLPRLQQVLDSILYPSSSNQKETSSSAFDVCTFWFDKQRRPLASSEEIATLEGKVKDLIKLTSMAMSLYKAEIDSSQLTKFQQYKAQFVQISKLL